MTGKVHRSVLYLWSAHFSVTKPQAMVAKWKAREEEGKGWGGGGAGGEGRENSASREAISPP